MHDRKIAFRRLAFAAAMCACLPALAGSQTYRIDPEHTYPSFEADHLGLSVWRGKFNRTEGSIVLDKAAETGSVDVRIDVRSVDFGHEKLNEQSVGESLFDTAHHPQAIYRGTLAAFRDGAPTQVDGQLTLHGVTRPLTLKILQFKCMQHMVFKREVCGADALASFERDDFGMSAGKDFGMDMTVTLRIQVEALQEDASAKAAQEPSQS